MSCDQVALSGSGPGFGGGCLRGAGAAAGGGGRLLLRGRGGLLGCALARKRIFLALHRTFKVGTGFDGDGLVDDVAFDPRGRGQTDLEPADTTDDAAVDHDIIGSYFAFDRGRFADGQKVGANVPFDGAFDLDVAGGLEIAGDMEVRGEDRCGGLALGAEALNSLPVEPEWAESPERSVLAGLAASSALGAGSLILLLENIVSSLDICHGVDGFAADADLVV